MDPKNFPRLVPSPPPHASLPPTASVRQLVEDRKHSRLVWASVLLVSMVIGLVAWIIDRQTPRAEPAAPNPLVPTAVIVTGPVTMQAPATP